MIGYNCLTPPLSPTDRVEGEDVEEQEAVVNGIALMLYLTDFIKAISMGECNTVASTFTMYRHLR